LLDGCVGCYLGGSGRDHRAPGAFILNHRRASTAPNGR
jgi:hypothetical protein